MTSLTCWALLILAAATGHTALAFAPQDSASSTHLHVCGDSPEQAQKAIEAIQRTVPRRARHLLTFSRILCDTNKGCCAAVSAAQASDKLSFNTQSWHDLFALGARMTVFARKSHSSFCANITTAGGEVVAVQDLGRESLGPEERMQKLQSLIDKLGVNRAVEYFSYEPRVGQSMPGQTLIPCGIPENVCSCSDEIEVHVWEDDPQQPQTLAHEVTHAWLYHMRRPFSHCSGRVPATGCRTVDQLTINAEREARLNARDPK